MDRRHEEAPLMRESEAQLADTRYFETGQRVSMKGKGLTMEGRERVMREKSLYEASMSGSVDSLNKLMKEDGLTLARVCLTCFDETPLHIAAMLGHADFATALLSHKPDLVIELDSRGFSPLHLASVNGYVEIVKKLLLVNSGVCLIRDEDGRTPLHLAVMKGRVDVINELVQARPEAIWYTLDRGETLLHSCVKHNRLGALKLLLESRRVDDFINVKDNDGNTILHIATTLKQMETIRYLLSRTGVKVNAVNRNGFTVLDIIEHTPRDLKGMEIRESLLNAGALRARNIPASARDDTDQIIRESEISLEVAPPSDVARTVQVAPQPPSRGNSKKKQKEDWMEKKRDALMIAASVIAAMAYQAGLNPPGGVWQEDDLKDLNNPKLAGMSIMANKYPNSYSVFWIYNTVSFVASLSTILLLVSGIPLKRRIFMSILMVAMWVTLSCMAATYLNSMSVISPEDTKNDIFHVIQASLVAWLGLIGIVFLVHTVRFLIWCVRKVLKLGKWLRGDQGQGNV